MDHAVLQISIESAQATPIYAPCATSNLAMQASFSTPLSLYRGSVLQTSHTTDSRASKTTIHLSEIPA
ncbi:hypothetical protein BDZ91DRAFT_752097, partial [Kalaharituber pfeilii]